MSTGIRIAAGCLLSIAAGAASAQTSELYIFSYTTNQAYVLQGGAVQRSFATGAFEFAGAVSGDVRTVQAYVGYPDGKQYDTNGNDLGGRYAYTGANYIYDATTDGVNYNYAAPYSDGRLWQFDRNWQNGTVLFNTNDSSSLGTAYDASTGTIWTASGNGTITHWDLNGNPLFQFSNEGGWYGLAFDPADQTLWATKDGSYPYINQYNQSGQLISQVYVGGFGMGNTLGMEFDTRGVPAPGAGALLGLSGVFAGRRRR